MDDSEIKEGCIQHIMTLINTTHNMFVYLCNVVYGFSSLSVYVIHARLCVHFSFTVSSCSGLLLSFSTNMIF